MSSTEAAAPAYEPTQEVRFAVVLYGGVSLAIYIHGVVQELLALVRATAPARPASAAGVPAPIALARDEELSGSARVFRELGRLLAHGENPDPEAPPPGAGPIRTRFVVDIVSGTSAGGINGVYLAKALVNDQSIEGLERLWIDEGDIGLLVNRASSYEGLGLEPETPPLSALSSQRMYWKLLDALHLMQGGGVAPGESPLVDELDLWVTATIVRGVTVPLDLADRTVFEKRFRKVFRFRYRNALAAGGAAITKDFEGERNPILAFAARATSAFPFAFAPVRLADIDAVVRSDHFRAAYAARDSRHADWRAYFAELQGPIGAGADERADDGYRFQALADGGYLDNKPFSWATETLPRRRADLPVDRRLIYVEPAPETDRVAPHPHGAEGEATAAWLTRGPLAHVPDELLDARPDALSNVLAAKVQIPTYEPIREDLERILVRNRDAGRLAELMAAVTLPEEQLDPYDAEAIDARGPQYVAYLQLRVAIAADALSQLVAEAAGFDEDSDERTAIRCLAQAWLEQQADGSEPPGVAANRLLAAYDLDYRIRRVNFVSRRASAVLEAAPDRADRDELIAAKRALGAVLVELRRADRDLRASADLRAAVLETGLTRSHLAHILRGADRDGALDRAREVFAGASVRAGITNVMDLVARGMEPAFTTASNGTAAAVAGLPRAHPVRGAYAFFELYDSIRFPITRGSAGEPSPVAVVRISPDDATAIFDPAAHAAVARDQRPVKLAGTALHHFGGFVDEEWRRRDLLWGRLDGAERIVSTLLPPGPLCDTLVRRAQDAILDEVLNEPATRPKAAEGMDREAFRAWLAQGILPELDPDRAHALAREFAPVTRKVLDGIGADGSAPKTMRAVAPPLAFVVRTAGVALRMQEWWARIRHPRWWARLRR